MAGRGGGGIGVAVADANAVARREARRRDVTVGVLPVAEKMEVEAVVSVPLVAVDL